jgi:hypothetical protein
MIHEFDDMSAFGRDEASERVSKPTKKVEDKFEE